MDLLSAEQCAAITPHNYTCSWPMVPPLCDQTWSEYANEKYNNANTIGTAFWLLMLLGAIVAPAFRCFVQILPRYKKEGWAKMNTMDKVQMMTLTNLFLTIISGLDFGGYAGIYPPAFYFTLKRLRAASLYSDVYLLIHLWYVITLDKSEKARKKKMAGRQTLPHWLSWDLVCNVGDASARSHGAHPRTREYSSDTWAPPLELPSL